MNQDDEKREERRTNWPQEMAPDFWRRLEKHMFMEDIREKADIQRLADGTKRMDKIEEDLQPLKRLYWAVVGSGGVVAALIALLIFIYSSDRNGYRMMQEAIYKQGTAIELLIRSYQNLEKNVDRMRDREQDRKA